MRLALVVIAVAACSKDGGGAATGSGSGSAATAAAGSAARAEKKGAGFSASLSAELAKEGSGSAAPDSAAGSATAMAGTAGSATAGSAAAAPAGSAVAAPAGTSKGSAVAAANTPSTSTSPPPAAETHPAATQPGGVERPGTNRVPVKPSAEQAAIKLDLEPNWDRDVGEAGTISFVLKVPNTADTRLFSFRYGYDPDSAPADRDAYMKWLADQKILNVTLNRQRGAAWYLEGTDGNGAPAFRYLVNYGGKHLICYGSLYKDAASNQLGDLRDKVVMAAKKICETMTL